MAKAHEKALQKMKSKPTGGTKTATATKTETSTKALTTDNVTVTGGAGDGDTSVYIISGGKDSKKTEELLRSDKGKEASKLMGFDEPKKKK